VIIIDEIGRESEALAARTIAERGVQLIATAHGNTLDNLLLNPTLSDLVGGIESVTLSDEEARRRGTQKTVLERRAPPTFDVLIEIQDRQRLIVHHDVAAAVDAMLRGWPLTPEARYRDELGQIHIERAAPPEDGRGAAARGRGGGGTRRPESYAHEGGPMEPRPLPTLRVYPYGIARNRLLQAVKRLRLPVIVVEDLDEADVLITSKSYYRRRPKIIVQADERKIPIYVLRSNTISQMEMVLASIFDLSAEETDTLAIAMRETQEAIQKVLAGAKSVDLSPQNAYIRRRQHEMARAANLISHSYGKEPYRHVRIYRE
ncbi:MAG: AAA family ATPase, partial [Chloroflexi bacterium]